MSWNPKLRQPQVALYNEELSDALAAEAPSDHRTNPPGAFLSHAMCRWKNVLAVLVPWNAWSSWMAFQDFMKAWTRTDTTRWIGVSWQHLGDGGLTGLTFGTLTRQDLRVIRKERDAAVIVTALGDGMAVASSRLTIQIANCWNLKDVQKSHTSYSVGIDHVNGTW